MSVQSDSFYFSAWFYHSMCEDIANYWFKLSNKHGIKCSESELEQYKQSTIEIIKRALNSGELPVYSKPDFAFVSPDNRKTASPDEVMFYSDIKRVLDKARPFNLMPDLPIFMEDYQEMEKLFLESQANIKQTSTANVEDNPKGNNEEISTPSIKNSIALNADTDINNSDLLKSQKQIIAILKAIKTKQWQPLAIPDGGKGIIREICETDYSDIFDCTNSFDEAWRKRDKNLIRMANHASYSKRGKQ